MQALQLILQADLLTPYMGKTPESRAHHSRALKNTCRAARACHGPEPFDSIVARKFHHVFQTAQDVYLRVPRVLHEFEVEVETLLITYHALGRHDPSAPLPDPATRRRALAAMVRLLDHRTMVACFDAVDAHRAPDLAALGRAGTEALIDTLALGLLQGIYLGLGAGLYLGALRGATPSGPGATMMILFGVIGEALLGANAVLALGLYGTALGRHVGVAREALFGLERKDRNLLRRLLGVRSRLRRRLVA